MTSTYDPIREDFDDELLAVRALVNAFSDPITGNPRTRVAAANSATLLLAATFEEFARETARAYARKVVLACTHPSDLPKKLSGLAWKRTMESLARLKVDGKDGVRSDARTRFNVAYEFCGGDLTQDIYLELIRNENNMRPGELNSLFNVSGLDNVCRRVCDKKHISEFFQEPDQDAANGILVQRLEAFGRVPAGGVAPGGSGAAREARPFNRRCSERAA